MSTQLTLIRKLLEALREWKCPACGGKGSYMQRGFIDRASRDPMKNSDKKFVSHHVQCKKCEGSGYHPIAREAIQTALNPPFNIPL